MAAEIESESARPKVREPPGFYVFNRVEKGGLRWISYQEAREQEIFAPDEELAGLISLGRGST